MAKLEPKPIEGPSVNKGLHLRVIHQDNDLVEIRVFGWNGAFGGEANVYIGVGYLQELAAKLNGFPQNASDIREVTLGAFGPDYAGGGVSMRFYCADQAGHAYVQTKIESEYQANGEVQFAQLLLPIEAAAIDDFVNQLRLVTTNKSSLASLASVTRES